MCFVGLYNDMLSEQKDFDDDLVSLLSLFLNRLQPPVCIISHNGFRFDFPLLKAELFSVERDLPEGLLCLDSWEMFRCLDGSPVLDRSQFIVSPEISKSQSKKPLVDCNLPLEASKRKKTNQEDDNSSSARLIGAAPSYVQHPFTANSVGCETERNSCCEVVSAMENSAAELTMMDSDLTLSQSRSDNDRVMLESYAQDKSNSMPVSSAVVSSQDCDAGDVGNISGTSLADMAKSLDDSSKGAINTNSESVVVSSALGSSLHSATSTDTCLIYQENQQATTENRTFSVQNKVAVLQNEQKNLRARDYTKKRVSYRLGEIHLRVLGCYPSGSHTAEDDCLALARIFLFTHNCTQWADSHAIPFSAFSPLYNSRRRKPPHQSCCP